ncbi:MAG TPA: glycoside hydrolase family 3 C-terminal domain-containing protein [Thermoleophilaceae bacterium]|nr:glycoside hydrolase family 3 C-terminal domain-containing protein [Thermoleophilaceae bacterium]
MKAALLVALVGSVVLASTATAAGRCGSAPWCDTSLSADQRAGLLLDALTRDEKISLLAGDELFGVAGGPGSHTGTSDGVERVGLPTTYYSDGPVGPRSGQATSMPAPMALAATFDSRLARLHGSVVGDEVKAKGNDVVFAPTVNLMRTPLGGRTFESFGEDPYIQARMGVEWIRGAQAQGVIGNAKHYAVNNQEGEPPGTLVGGGEGSRQLVDAIVDERTLREMYLPHFEAAVKEANVGSVMCAYNRVNGEYACENEHLLERVLKGDWGFDGYVLADYGATRNTANSLNNGLDFEPWPGFMYGPTPVMLALTTGQASESAVDEHVRRILRTLFAYGFFDRDAYPYDDSRIDKQGHAAAARRIEEAGIVLMRNTGVLPLRRGRVRSLALIGEDAERFKSGGGSSMVQPFAATTPKQGIERRAATAGVEVHYDTGENEQQAASVAQSADVAVVVVADTSSEGTDKPCMALRCGREDGRDPDRLIARVAAANPRTIVVLETGAPVLTPWRDDVEGVLEIWYPGLEGGTALARVLFGDVDPGGRLPATFPHRESDYPYSGDREAYPGVAERVRYKEGVFVGYRWFDDRRRQIAFPFGHGLSYTRFRFSGVRIRRAPRGARSSQLGGRPRYRVSMVARNVGRRRGIVVPQVYLGLPEPSASVRQPPRALKGFAKLTLRPRQRRRVNFDLNDRSLSYFDVNTNSFRVAPGCYRVAVGTSSRRTRARMTIGVGSGRSPRARRVRVRRGRNVIWVSLRRGRRAARGQSVTVKGPSFTRSARTNRRGRIRFRVRARRAGVASVSTVACASRLRARVVR